MAGRGGAGPRCSVEFELSQHQRQQLLSPPAYHPLGLMTVLWKEMETGRVPLD